MQKISAIITKNYLVLITFLFLSGSSQVYGQVAGSFDIYTIPSRFGEKPMEYFKSNGFETGVKIMTEKTIMYSYDHSRTNLASVGAWLAKYYPNATSTGWLILDWESGPYDKLRDNPKGSPRFIKAEKELLKLINEVKKLRPNVKVSIYQMPFRVSTTRHNDLFNALGKFDKIFDRLDFICPSVYILTPDEVVGHQSNLNYIKFNLDVALPLGKKHNKPVLPFVWHKVHPGNKKYGDEILQKEVFAKYIKFIYAYSLNGRKAGGVWWWDGASTKLKDLSGINNHLKGKVKNKATYDAMIVDYANHVKHVLKNSSDLSITDNTAPIVTGVVDGGIYNVEKRIYFNEGTATLNNKPFTSNKKVKSEGNYTLVVKDMAGNTNKVRFTIDKTRPTGTLLFNTNSKTINTTKVMLKLTHKGGAVAMRFKRDGDWGKWEPLATTKAWTLPAGNGTKTASVQFRDAAGNISASAYDVVTLKQNRSKATRQVVQEIEEENEEAVISSLAVYPNPATTKLHIEISEAGSGETIINLLNLTGQVALTQKVNTTTSLTTVLDVDQLQPGVYILSINTPKGYTSKRVVIQ